VWGEGGGPLFSHRDRGTPQCQKRYKGKGKTVYQFRRKNNSENISPGRKNRKAEVGKVVRKGQTGPKLNRINLGQRHRGSATEPGLQLDLGWAKLSKRTTRANLKNRQGGSTAGTKWVPPQMDRCKGRHNSTFIATTAWKNVVWTMGKNEKGQKVLTGNNEEGRVGGIKNS